MDLDQELRHAGEQHSLRRRGQWRLYAQWRNGRRRQPDRSLARRRRSRLVPVWQPRQGEGQDRGRAGELIARKGRALVAWIRLGDACMGTSRRFVIGLTILL